MSNPAKLLVAVCVSLLLSLHSRSQLNVSLGLKGGANYFTVIGGDADGETGLIAPYRGALLRLTKADNEYLKFLFQAELNYSIQGYKYEEDKTTLSYVTLPLMIHRYIGQSNFFLEVGPQLGFLVSAKSKTLTGTTDIKAYSNSFDFSGNVGFGYLTNTGLGFNLRGNKSFLSNSKDYNLQNAGASFGLYYVFGYGGYE